MLEAKNLTKIYKPKKGVPVKALDGVNICFPDTGMVFLLGKSGSGKSTLLNVLGGLDRYDEGDITIKGVSSGAFKQSDFDSYRNTFVGFIFQEYNVLNDFSVGANIALALELQGKKADDKTINHILEQVDLAGFGSRKPNELSGGQKQRVAIARALVKNPEIIMADEPTGALDSATGKQVLDTLKKLSRDKLVIVVSHDREFAEAYADRIIELADGKVISDMQYEEHETEQQNLSFSGDMVTLKEGYHLTEQDREQINAYIDALQSGNMQLYLNRSSRRASHPTEHDKLPKRSSASLKFIRSKLPLKNAFKIGASGLKYKKFRLVITILLSCISFGLFGLSDTFGAYNHIKTCVKSISDTGVRYASVSKSIKREGDDYYTSGYYLSDNDLAEIKKKTGIEMLGVYSPKNMDLNFMSQYDENAQFTKSDNHIYPYGFNGFAQINETYLQDSGYKILAGKLPDGNKNEIAISEYICQTFMIGGYRKDAAASSFEKISQPADMVGKTLVLGGVEYTVSGIIDTQFDIERYKSLIEEKTGQSSADKMVDFVLQSELNAARGYSIAQVAMVSNGFFDRMLENYVPVYELRNGGVSLCFKGDDAGIYPMNMADFKDLPADAVIWKNGKTELQKNEVLVDENSLASALEEQGLDADTFWQGDRTLEISSYWYYNQDNLEAPLPNGKYTVAGVLNTEKYPQLSDTSVWGNEGWKEFVELSDGLYQYAVGAMPTEQTALTELVSFCYQDSPIRFAMQNAVTFELDTVNEALALLSNVFFWIGIGFALFAALMLANFISTSISYKKQEIGILRAIGSRSNDVFRIFFSESFIIAMINFVLSSVGVGIVTAVINYMLRYRVGILVTVLRFGIRQIGLLLILSILIAVVASFIPVRRIAAKKPIDAIRSR